MGKTAVQPLAMDVLGANYGNPYNKAHVAGGGNTGEGFLAAAGSPRHETRGKGVFAEH